MSVWPFSVSESHPPTRRRRRLQVTSLHGPPWPPMVDPRSGRIRSPEACMTRGRLLIVIVLAALVPATTGLHAQKPVTSIAQYLSPGYPVEVASAARAERI